MDFINLSEEEVLLITLVIDEEEELSGKELSEEVSSEKRQWVHPLWQCRSEQGEFANLIKSLMDYETKFFEYFRMPRSGFELLLSKIAPYIEKQDTAFRLSVSAKERLAVCLRFLATGDSLKTISFNYRLGHSTVHEIVIDTCKKIVQHLLAEMIPEPTEETWTQTAKDFWERWQFPNCIGAIDGKHILMEAPPNSGSLYFNYKKTFSTVLMALVDAKYRFLYIDVGACGRSSDGGIFSNSVLGRRLEQQTMNVPPNAKLPGTDIQVPHVILGDEAFPLKTYLMRPYPGSQLTDERRVYNYRLSRGRRVSENAFGILCQRFTIFYRKMKAKPEHADNIVAACCILHNFIINLRHTSTQNTSVQDISTANTSLPHWDEHNERRQGTREAFKIRDIYTSYFNSETGSVDWQLDQI